jgi:hypothetical protein
MKKKLISILFCIGVLVVILSGCKKENKTSDDTFTKWITDYPNMAGVVGGDVGTGTFAGEVLSLVTVGDTTHIEAIYHFNGKYHSFIAHVFVTQNDVVGIGAIAGHVTDGWFKGGTVTGEYNVYLKCPIPTPGNSVGTQCYQGALHIQVP